MGKSKVDKSVEIKKEVDETEQILGAGTRYVKVTPLETILRDSFSTAPTYRADISAIVVPRASTLKQGNKLDTPLADLLESPIGLISVSQDGLSFESFLSIAYASPFTIEDWAGFLQLSEQKLASLQKENKTFSQAQSEIILQIAQLQKLSEEVLGGQEQFAIWASAPSLAFEGKRPKDFFGSTFGIQMLTTELHRIEYGILA